MGFPAGSYTGFAFTSIFEVAMPGKSAPETEGVRFFSLPSFFMGAIAGVVSFVLVLWGTFRISL
jgi:hypothetical protein